MRPNPRYHDSDGHFRKGNPGGGRRKGFRRLMDDLYRVLAEVASGDEVDQVCDRLDIPPGLRAQIELAPDRQEALVRVMVHQALRSDGPAREAILSRIEPAVQRVEANTRNFNAQLTAQVGADDAKSTYMALVAGEDPDDGGGEPADGE